MLEELLAESGKPGRALFHNLPEAAALYAGSALIGIGLKKF